MNRSGITQGMWQPGESTWASAGSADRTKQPICDLLTSFIASEDTIPRHILEIASGFGTHMKVFADALPNIQFYPTEAQDSCIEALGRLERSNIRPPMKLNVLDDSAWNTLAARVESKGDQGTGEAMAQFDGLLCINMIHISPLASTPALFRGAAQVLRKHGFIMLYGAYLSDDGSFASPADTQFNESLKSRNADFGLRDPKWVNQVAQEHGFTLVLQRTMALNNRVFIWRLS